MNKIVKKILTFAAATVIAATSAFAVSAEYYKGGFLGHSTDEWEYGNDWWITGNYQYSNFLCKKQTHTATAVIVVSSRNRDEVKKEAKKGKWAKAQTKRHSSYEEWNSYFNHPGGAV